MADSKNRVTLAVKGGLGGHIVSADERLAAISGIGDVRLNSTAVREIDGLGVCIGRIRHLCDCC